MRHRRAMILLLGVALLAIPLATGASSSKPEAVCSADPAVPAEGEEVVFSATNLSGGPTRVEIISGTNGGYYYAWSLGNGSSYSFEWSFPKAGVYAAVFSKDTQSGIYRMKCDVYVTVG